MQSYVSAEHKVCVLTTVSCDMMLAHILGLIQYQLMYGNDDVIVMSQEFPSVGAVRVREVLMESRDLHALMAVGRAWHRRNVFFC